MAIKILTPGAAVVFVVVLRKRMPVNHNRSTVLKIRITSEQK